MKKIIATVIFACLSLSTAQGVSKSVKVEITSKTREKTRAQAIHRLVYDLGEQHGVPAEIVLAVLYYETGYKGYYHNAYSGRYVSSCGALGPMQIMPRYVRRFIGRKISKSRLLNDYKINIEVGVRMLAYHFAKYRSWEKALGAYSCGVPKSNAYGRKVLRKAQLIGQASLEEGTHC